MNTPLVSGSTATLIWTNVSLESGYRLGRAVYDKTTLRCGTISVVQSLGTDVTQTTDSPGAGAYCYAIQAFNSVGTSAWSNTVGIEWKGGRKR
jgi:hypothetical protein